MHDKALKVNDKCLHSTVVKCKNDANVSAKQQQAFIRANGDSSKEALKSTKRAWLDDVVITLIITLKRNSG